MMLSDDVCLYIGSKSRTERPRKTKIGREVAHVTRESDTTFKVKKSKVKVTRPLCSPPCLAREAGGRENVLGVGNYCYVASARRRARRWGAPTGGAEGRGHIVLPRARLVSTVWWWMQVTWAVRVSGWQGLLRRQSLQIFTTHHRHHHHHYHHQTKRHWTTLLRRRVTEIVIQCAWSVQHRCC